MQLKWYVMTWVRKYMIPIPSDADVSFGAWLPTTPYPKHRKDELEQVAIEYEGCEPDTENESFGKRETYLKYKPPRGINSRHDSFKCFSGPYFSLIERQLFSMKEFIKHIPVKDRPKYLIDMFGHLPGPFLETDYSHFESHFERELMDSCEIVLYEWMLQNFPVASRIITKALTGRNRCKFRDFTLEIDAVRMSGDMCTSLGNGFTNMMLVNFVAASKGGEVVGVFEGDDGLVYSTVPIDGSDFSRLGFEIKILVHTDFLRSSFCGMMISSDMIHMTDPRKVILNFGWTHSPLMHGGRKVAMGLLRAKALSLLYENPRCPVISVLAKRFVDLTEGVEARWETNWYETDLQLQAAKYFGWAVAEYNLGIPDQTRLDFDEAYDISPIRQKMMESYFRLWAWTSSLIILLLMTCLGPSSMIAAITTVGLWFAAIVPFDKLSSEMTLNYGATCGSLGEGFSTLISSTIMYPVGFRQATLWWTKTVRKLNSSVLTKMPRDCTAPNLSGCTVLDVSTRIPYFDMQTKYVRTATRRGGKSKRQTSGKSRANKRDVTVAPANVNVRTVGSIPEIVSERTKTVIRNREFIIDVPGSVAYAITVPLSINPGNVASFPWLSSIANSYEAYHFRRLRFEFVPNRGTSTSGSVWMAVDYDASDSPPTSKVELASFSHSVRSSIWSPLNMDCSRQDMDLVRKRFTAHQGVSTGNDRKLYDVGNVYVAIQGAPDTNSVGDLWVDYEVELETPQMNNPIAMRSKDINTSSPSVDQPLLNATMSGLGDIELNNNDAAGSDLIFDAAGDYVMNLTETGTSITNTPVVSVPAGSGSWTATSSVVLASGLTAALSGILTIAFPGARIRLTSVGRAASLATVRAIISAFVKP